MGYRDVEYIINEVDTEVAKGNLTKEDVKEILDSVKDLYENYDEIMEDMRG